MRIGLAGGGTDIAPFYQDYGGCSLTVTIKKYAYASFNGNPDNSLFASTIKKHLGYKGEISTRKDAENLSGLGGSAAFAVAVIGLLAMGRMSKQAVAEMAMDIERNQMCFPAGTLILSDSGSKKIENIQVGDKVLSFNESTHQKEFKTVSVVFNNISSDLVTVKTLSGNRVKCTSDHPFFVAFREGVMMNDWIKAKDLRKGDQVIQYNTTGTHYLISNFNKKGKTVEELYGDDKGKKIRKSVKKARKKDWKNKDYIDKMKSLRSDLSYEEYFGNDRAAEIKDKLHDAQMKQLSDPKYRVKQKKGIRKKFKDVEYRNKVSKVVRERSLGKTYEDIHGEEKGSVLRRNVGLRTIERMKQEEILFRTYKRRPSKLEKDCRRLLYNNFPKEWSHTGSGKGSFSWIGNKEIGYINPDFRHRTLKKIIEIFDNYHKIKVFATVDNYIKIRTQQCLDRGYEVLFLESFFFYNNYEEVIRKVKDFIYNPGITIVDVDSVVAEKDNNVKVYNLEVEDNNNYFANFLLVHNCVKGGVQDFFASATGGFNYFEYNSDGVNVLPMLRTSFVDKLESSILLFFTTKRDLDGSGVQDDVIMRINEGQNIEALFRAKELTNEARRAIRKERLHEFGEILDISWTEKKKLSKFISNEKLDELYESCRNNGAIAGKLMGAGGGGYMLLLCSDVDKCANYLSSRNFVPERVTFDWDGLVVGDL